MAKSAWQKVIGFFGFGPEDDDLVEDEAAAPPPLRPEARVLEEEHGAAGRRGALVSLPGKDQKQFKVLLVEPRAFEEVQTIVDQLKQRRPIILNLEPMDKEMAQRILNFLNGAIYALGGETQRVSSGIFFFAPSNVDITTIGRGFTGTAIGGGSDVPGGSPVGREGAGGDLAGLLGREFRPLVAKEDPPKWEGALRRDK